MSVGNESTEDLASELSVNIRNLIVLRLLLRSITNHSQTLYITNQIKRRLWQLNSDAFVPQKSWLVITGKLPPAREPVQWTAK